MKKVPVLIFREQHCSSYVAFGLKEFTTCEQGRTEDEALLNFIRTLQQLARSGQTFSGESVDTEVQELYESIGPLEEERKIVTIGGKLYEFLVRRGQMAQTN